MSVRRVVALVLGCLLVLPGLALLLGGGVAAVAYAVARDDDGYFTSNVELVKTASPAVTAEDITFATEPGSPDWLIDTLDADVRLRVTPTTGAPVFVGIAREADVDAFLSGVAHDEVSDIDDDNVVYRSRDGSAGATAPADEDFWTVSATGTGTQELEWEAASGRWAAVLMNPDGTAGVAADVDVGVKSGLVLPLALGTLATGVVLTVGSVALIVAGASGTTVVPAPVAPAEAPPVTSPGRGDAAPHPLRLEANLDPDLSRWQWLVKWLLAVPHLVVLVFLWLAFAVLTVVAGVVILFTGRYPRAIFAFNEGVMRWTWRVTYYATTGGLGTDRYPPFSLHAEPNDLAILELAYPARLSRGLALVKWWLLAIPHYVIVGVIAGSVTWLPFGAGPVPFDAGGGLLAVLVLIAGAALLFTGRYPPALFDLVVGLNRWVWRVVAYAALMTDTYPPFRLDQGGAEPAAREAAQTAPSISASDPGKNSTS